MDKIAVNKTFVEGEIVVKFNDFNKKFDKATGIGSVDKISNKHGLKSTEKLFDKRLKNEDKFKFSNIYKFKFSEEYDMIQIAKDYSEDPNIEYAEPNYINYILAVPNDASYSSQWAHQKIQSEKAWDIEKGNKNTIIAVIDTGVDWDHPDLAANIWNNTDEDCNNATDLDGNGYYGDCRGYDFVNTTDSYCYGSEDCLTPDNNPMDYQGHGTHVAGIAGAVANNSIGIAGICWNCSIMPVRAGWKNDGGGGSLENDDAALAILYSADNNASIISMSWGSYSSSSLIEDSINYAYSRGSVLIAAAGNENANQMLYPASYDNAIAVAATDNSDAKASFSNFGYWVDIAAPGSNIFSTVLNDAYGYKSGTSMATPYVSGLAGLIMSKNSSLTNEQVRSIIISSSDPLNYSIEYFGNGRINAYKALLINYTPNARISYPAMGNASAGIINISGNASSLNFQSYSLEYSASYYPEAWSLLYNSTSQVVDGTLFTLNTTALTDGTYRLRLTVNATNGYSRNSVIFYIANDNATCYSCGDCSYKLSKEGANVALANNISSCNCININANNTILDCNNKWLNGCGESTVDIDNWNKAVGFAEKSGILVKNCKFKNFDLGLYMRKSENITFRDNYFLNNYHGSYVANSSFIYAYNNTFTNRPSNDRIGLYLADSDNIDVINNSFQYSYYSSIYLERSNNNTVKNNIVNRSGSDLTGIQLVSSRYNAILNNTVIYTAGDGILLQYSENNSIMNNTIRDNYNNGLTLGYESHNNKISNNYLSSNSNKGIRLIDSSYNNLTNNSISGSKRNLEVSYVVGVYEKKDYNNSIDTSNKVNGKPVYYFFDEQDEVIDNIEAGHIGLAASRNITVRNVKMNNSDGIYLIYTPNSSIYNDTLTNYGDYGISLYGSSYNTISNNFLSKSAIDGSGILVTTSSNNNIVTNNTFALNDWAGIRILSGSKFNSFYYNNISNNDRYGISIDGNNNTFGMNYISNNTYDGAYVFYSYDIKFENNNFYNTKRYHIDTDYSVEAINNWWEATDINAIGSKINGPVDYCPFLNAPYPYGISINCLEYNISLTQGWNLLSFPLMPFNKTLPAPLSSIKGNYSKVFAYNNSKWLMFDSNNSSISNLKEIDEKTGFWIKMNNSGVLKINGTELISVNFSLKKGLNLISYPTNNTKLANETFNTNFENTLTYENSSWKSYSPTKPSIFNTLKNMTPGYGYWVKVSSDVNWTFNSTFNPKI